ncbi:bifunctional aconitate hydratase 2/2-methylisocitrate dehydratase [Psychrobacter sanguinis]|uniref:bifunctional aconitate hydratase 2/2-methylisocitrate dehydratase n=2 Tax=Psychrobacter sanguinis TaxID=861445 RepID=UPI00020C7937|nr:bifunctional aconitate hydratase 2/2-methylisocitrate dehydratase [Psychrobacter sanguinis]EGK15098.1 bifunctional aconitate hydratase 2/2-methylisocitrate dehydratase [Psychrobacter sp. 1501(2011)]MCC3308087.1 bifunctional aconitate hydratase 2/2-methylisocitrate dehydratase [Psychrobacter sanguinis]MCC3344163.1 bifunctional aconitate hydratase 2/2-methylisocitrate dehydratase [Psychrobacter sanguinis]MCD9151174.1 bifunctional aconitate hydratase 2/2-methylisocitrate dehydratase [Psychrobac
MLDAYRKHVEERAQLGTVPLPLSEHQTADLVELLKNPPAGEEEFLMDLLVNRVPAGVDQAAYVKAAFLAAIVKGEAVSPLIDKKKAVDILGTMQGGYNVLPLVEALDDAEVAENAAAALKKTLLVFDAFNDVTEKAEAGNEKAKEVVQSWADAEWFLQRPEVPQKSTYTAFKVTGETNTDDLSPAQDAWSRPDIPLHSLAMHKNSRDGIQADEEGVRGPMKQIEALKEKGFPLAYVGDVVGTGSSRKSATNSVLWLMGDDIPNVPNKRGGGLVLGGKIAPIFYNTMEDSGALPIEDVKVDNIEMGDVFDIYPYEGKITKHDSDEVLSTFKLNSATLLDEVRAGGRIPLIVGRALTNRARDYLGLEHSDVFAKPEQPASSDKGYTLAQKMVGKACGMEGVRPGMYCEPKMTTVGSQDTTGPMTRDELKDLACLGFQADLVMQSFCHTAAYPKPVDVETQHTLPDFIMNRGGVSLRPGDGIIHSWLNRMLLPDTVGTGGDSHTRFPMGISFPAGSGLVAFAAATGVMPLDMPESVRVRFVGERQPGITLRDLVHAIPLQAIKEGYLTVDKKGKINEFNGRILEIEGLEDLTVEQAFELSDASAERSAAGCTITLSEESVTEYLNSNITLLKWMISEGYGDARTLSRRIEAMQEWLKNPSLMRADEDAEYAIDMTIDMSQINEPVLCCPNDPDDAKTLSDVAGDKIDEVFIGSCMTNIGHFRAAGKLLQEVPAGSLKTRLWIAPPTKMDARQLMEEGYYNVYAQAGARTEMPGCSLCMGNQARIAPGSTAVSTSTRNFPNRLGQGANVYLASAELAAVAAVLGKLPTNEEYQQYAGMLNSMGEEVYRYMNFDQMETYSEEADKINVAQLS